MPGSNHGPSIKCPHIYEALRRKGYSKEKAARISNAKCSDDGMVIDRDLPLEVQLMPTAARAIFRAAYRKALKEKPDQLAAMIGLRAVKQEFTQIENEEGEEEWVNKEEHKKESEKELQEAMEAIEAEGGEIDPETGERIDPETGEPIEEEEGDDEGESGESSSSDPDDEPEEYTKTTKTTETSETARRRRREEDDDEEGTTDSVQLTEMLTLDSAGFRLTEDGYLVAAPRVARTGIQIYKGWEVGNPYMDEVRVYRPEEEVFNIAAMTSLAHRPITLEHPESKVDATNWRKLAVGKSDGDVARDGDFIRVPLVLMDAAAIGAAQEGKSQLSVGYGAKLVWGDGITPSGEHYDAMQTEIRANHIALVSKARGGDKLKIGDQDDLFDREFSGKEREKAAEKGQAMEHGGFPIKNASDLRNAIRAIGRAKNPAAAKTHIKKRARALGLTQLLPESWGDSESDHRDQQRRPSMDRTLTIDGVNIALEDKDGQILERHLNELRKQIGDCQTKDSTLTAQVAELTKAVGIKDGEIAALKQKVEDAKQTPDQQDEALELRMDVIDRATSFFGDAQKYNWKGKTVQQMRRDVVTARMGDQRAKLMNDDAVEGAFLSVTEPETQDGFRQMTQSFSRPPVGNINDRAASAYDQRNKDLSTRWMRNKTKANSASA